MLDEHFDERCHRRAYSSSIDLRDVRLMTPGSRAFQRSFTAPSRARPGARSPPGTVSRPLHQRQDLSVAGVEFLFYVRRGVIGDNIFGTITLQL